MSVVLHISDPHFGTEQPQVAEALLQMAHTEQPDVAIISGDITQRATREQFDTAQTFIKLLGIPAVVIPGNHDIPLFNLIARAFSPYGNYMRVFGKDLEPTYRSDDLLIASVRTTRRYRHKDGTISKQQVAQVRRLLETAEPGQMRIVVTHQPVFVTEQQDEHNLLHGRMHAIQQWAEAGADLIVGGHIHLPFVVPLHERLSGLAKPLWAIQAGTAISTRIRRNAGNSVNVIRYDPAVEPGHGILERWDYDDTHFRFEQRTSQRLALGHRP